MKLGLLILAIVLFAIGAIMAFVTKEPQWVEAITLYGGLTSFAASFLPFRS